MANSEPAPANGAKQLLVVDDDPSVREMLVRVLKSDGYSAWSAADGKEALAFTASQPIDLVLLDLGLPGKDGWETFDALVRQKPQVAVIIITARANQRAIAEAVGAGALFEKPLDFPELLRAISRLLAEPPRPHRVSGATAHFFNATRGHGAR